MKKKVLALSFLLPITILVVIFAILEFYPLGDNTILFSDLRGQYSAYLSYLESVLIGENNILYSFSKTLGGNFFSFAAYYLFSPFNILILFSNMYNLPVMICFIIILKIGACGFTMSYYLLKKKESYACIIFATSYALMSYNVAYMYNLMWLDCVVILPVIMCGLDALTKKETVPTTYIISLAYAMICNYYIAFMICLFLVIYVLFFVLINIRDKMIYQMLFRFILSSIVAGLLAAFVLFPVVLSLQGGKSELNRTGLNFNGTYELSQFIANCLPGNCNFNTTVAPYIYCGTITLILCIMYFFNKQIEIRKKILVGFILAFMHAATYIQGINIIFHAFSEPAGFPWRYSFIICFITVQIAYQQWCCMKNIGNCSRIMSIILVVLIGEISFNGYDAVKKADAMGFLKMSQYVEKIGKVSNDIEKIPVDEEKSFYRTEKTYDISLNDAMYYKYFGISHFSSTDSLKITKFMKNMGYTTYMETGNWSGYTGHSTIAADSLLGIKYIISESKPNSWYNLIDEKIYINPFAFQLAFPIKKEDISEETVNPFEYQNRIFKGIFGEETNLFTLSELKDLKVSEEELAFRFRTENEKSPCYLFVENYEERSGLQIYVNDEEISTYMTLFQNGTLYLGDFDKNEYVNIVIKSKELPQIEQIRVAYLDMKAFAQSVKKLEDSCKVIVRKESSSRLEAEVDVCEEDKVGKLAFSIPYDKGWKVWVDGDKVDTSQCLNALLQIDITNGKHFVELKYIPPGLTGGCVVSLFSLFGLIVCGLKQHKRKNGCS